MADEKIAKNPEVILDVLFEKGLLFFVIKNTSSHGARTVRFEFSPKVMGVNGSKVISNLNIFRSLDYLAPQKDIRIFIDTAVSYFSRKEPTQIKVAITWMDESENNYTRIIDHNLDIYKDLGYLTNID